jgi:hypothetical protein
MTNSFPYDPILSRQDDREPKYEPCSKCGQPIDTSVPPWGNGWNCDKSGKVWHIDCPPKANHIEVEIPY